MSWKENTRVCTRCHAWRQKVDGDSPANGHLSAEVETREPGGGGGTDGGSDVKQEEVKKSRVEIKAEEGSEAMESVVCGGRRGG